MKRILSLLIGALGVVGALAQDPAPLVEQGEGGTWNYSWYGQSGRTFFLQYSEDLEDWSYFPIIEEGVGSEINWGFFTTADALYLRLMYTDTTVTNAYLDDFDGDGIANWVEIELLGTNPLEADTDGDGTNDNLEDSDGDGLLDVEEALWGAGSFSTANSDGDGWSDAVELEMGTNPFLADTDGDGVNDDVDPLPLVASETISADPTPLVGPEITILSPEVTPYP